MKGVVDEFVNGYCFNESIIDEYITSQAILQTVTNPSGRFYGGLGLGEPKFGVDESPFNAPWGRPQRDGPALRAITLMTYIDWLLDKDDGAKGRKGIDVVWPVVMNDLNYVGQYWNQTSFDLWEEVHSSSFFTLQMQHRAMVEGVRIAARFATHGGREISCRSCESQAPEISCFLQSFWNGKYILSNINTNNGRTGIDTSTILASILSFDIEANCEDTTFQPCSSKSLANFKAVIDSFRPIYSINNRISQNRGVAVGRYAEDVYQGGNPWYLCTLAAAEFLYDVAAQLDAHGVIKIDETSLPFYQQISPTVKVGILHYGSTNSPFQQVLRSIITYADSFVAIVRRYTPADGTLFEQFDRNTGTPVSAIDLTWSYAAFISMSSRRAGMYPPTWGAAQSTPPPPSICSATSAKGTYIPAVEAGAPDIPFVCTSPVTFNVNATTYFGENIYIIGDVEELGAWNPGIAAPMGADGYTAERPLWTLTLDLPAEIDVVYKYLRRGSDGSYVFEDGDRVLTTNDCGDPALILEESWSGSIWILS